MTPFLCSFILSSLVEIPAYIIILLFMDIWGRKPLFSLSLVGSGTLVFIALYVIIHHQIKRSNPFISFFQIY